MHTSLPDTEARGHLAGRLLRKKERENPHAGQEARRFHKREPPGLFVAVGAKNRVGGLHQQKLTEG
jgi:hypothetical protein